MNLNQTMRKWSKKCWDCKNKKMNWLPISTLVLHELLPKRCINRGNVTRPEHVAGREWVWAHRLVSIIGRMVPSKAWPCKQCRESFDHTYGLVRARRERDKCLSTWRDSVRPGRFFNIFFYKWGSKCQKVLEAKVRWRWLVKFSKTVKWLTVPIRSFLYAWEREWNTLEMPGSVIMGEWKHALVGYVGILFSNCQVGPRWPF